MSAFSNNHCIMHRWPEQPVGRRWPGWPDRHRRRPCQQRHPIGQNGWCERREVIMITNAKKWYDDNDNHDEYDSNDDNY